VHVDDDTVREKLCDLRSLRWADALVDVVPASYALPIGRVVKSLELEGVHALRVLSVPVRITPRAALLRSRLAAPPARGQRGRAPDRGPRARSNIFARFPSPIVVRASSLQQGDGPHPGLVWLRPPALKALKALNAGTPRRRSSENHPRAHSAQHAQMICHPRDV